MIPLLALAQDVQDFMESRNWRFCIIGGIAFEDSAIQRATYHSYSPDISLKTCSAEDLIVFKTFANRTKDWADVESVVTRQSDLEWKYIFEQLKPLADLKDAPEIVDRLEAVKKKFYRP